VVNSSLEPGEPGFLLESVVIVRAIRQQTCVEMPADTLIVALDRTALRGRIPGLAAG
jgi:hypothetical protein